MSSESAVCFISLCGVGRAEMSVCVYRRPKSAVRRIGSRALPLICAHRTMCCRPSRNRGVEECAAAAGLSASAEAETQTCAARAPARRPLRESRTHRRFFSPVGAKACPCSAAYGMPLRGGVSEKQAYADAACAYVRENAASPAAVLLGKVRLRSRSVRADSARALCAFRRDVSGNGAAKSGEAVFAANKKSVCGAQPQTLIVHPFFFASR